MIQSGAQRFDLSRGESVGMRFLRFRGWLREMLMRPGSAALTTVTKRVDVIAVERAHHRGGAATALCVGLSTVVLEEAASLGIETTAVPTTTLKKFFTGKGNASKEDMIREAYARWGHRHLEGREAGDDECDALAVLAWTLKEIGES